MSYKPVLGILLGDGGGVGPEIIAKLAAERFFDEYARIVFIGDLRILNRAFDMIGKKVDVKVVDDVKDSIWDDGVYPIDRKSVV